MTPTVSRPPLGKTQPYDAGISPQSSTIRPANRRADRFRHGYLQFKPEIYLGELRARMPGGDAGRAVSADDHLRGHGGPVGEPGAGAVPRLVNRSHQRLLPHHRALLLRVTAAPRRTPPASPSPAPARARPGELPAAAQGERDGPDLVPGGHLDLPRDGAERRPDQAAAARLVPRMFRPLEHDRPRPGRGRRAGRGQPGRARPRRRRHPTQHVPAHQQPRSSHNHPCNGAPPASQSERPDASGTMCACGTTSGWLCQAGLSGRGETRAPHGSEALTGPLEHHSRGADCRRGMVHPRGIPSDI